jgi:hypothetical protein
LFAGQCKRHKDGLALKTSEECAAINRLFDLDDLRFDGLGLRGLGSNQRVLLGPGLPEFGFRGLLPWAILFVRLHCWLM